MSSERTQETVERILQSSKYRSLDRSFVERIVIESSDGRTRKAAEKEARRRLHQAYGAFVHSRPSDAVRRACTEIGEHPERALGAWKIAMSTHRSTVERVPFLAEFERLVSAWCGDVSSVVDIAGGLGALTIPWLPILPDGTFHSIDIDADLAAALVCMNGHVAVTVSAECVDLVERQPVLSTDLVLALKAVTTLDTQRRGAANEVLKKLEANHLILSFPCRSLGGGRRYTVDPLEQAASALSGTRFTILHDHKLGPEHYVYASSTEA